MPKPWALQFLSGGTNLDDQEPRWVTVMTGSEARVKRQYSITAPRLKGKLASGIRVLDPAGHPASSIMLDAPVEEQAPTLPTVYEIRSGARINRRAFFQRQRREAGLPPFSRKQKESNGFNETI